MPIAVDPNARIRFVLSTDKGNDPEPTFIIKNLTARDYGVVNEICDKHLAGDKPDPTKYILETIAFALTGWENLKGFDNAVIGYSKEAAMEFDALLTPAELKELLDAVMDQGARLEDKKKLESPSESDTARRAKDAKGKKRAKKSRQKPHR